MKHLILGLIVGMFSTQSFASNCFSEVTQAFTNFRPLNHLVGIQYKGVLKAGEDRPYLQHEIWNDTKMDLDMYEIDSAFMATFMYVALVNKKTCKTEKIIEVFFEI